MSADGFLRDVLAAPERLATLLDAYSTPGSPLQGIESHAREARRVVLLGMGSSRFAAETVAARLRARGVDAVAELASTGAPTAPRDGTLVVGISASGSTPETVESLERHRGRGTLVAVTNHPGAPLAEVADHVLPLYAGDEEGGVSCLTFPATLAVLHLLAGAPVGALRPAVESAAELRAGRGAWLEELAGLLSAASATYLIAPAERISSALQGALMLREGPRLAADATETGDWLHVDVYLSKRPGYTALLFPGSRFDGEVRRWLAERSSTFVAAGRELPGAQVVAPFRGADDPLVQSLVETGVAELAAAELWRRGLLAGDPAL